MCIRDRSSTEAKYKGVANAAAEVVWLQSLLRELAIISPDSTTLISPSLVVHTASRTPSYHSAPSSFRGRGRSRGSERGRGHGRSFLPPHQSASSWPQCQICNRFDHYANQYYNRYDDSASPTALLYSYENSLLIT